MTPRPRLTPDTLVRAGAELADELGFAHLTPSSLARRVGVRPPSLYAHLAGADDLRARVAVLALGELTEAATTAAAGLAGRDALAAVAAAHRDYARAHPGRWDAARHPLDDATAAASAGPRMAGLMRAVLRGYGLDEPDATHAVRLLGAVVHGFVTLEAAGGFAHSAPDATTSWEWVLDSLDRLLTDRSGGTP
ncbi:TetR/AcrR family transcriptional regulator [uncultured Nocardioides sp.]|uniref:TetR/AcrR family transcriptional regulator n=1 Tax=uncultured Nocardioides sp. TaxID=198441 RepID=UPI00260FA665|nr:TetR/AcrR family transcriptional regulator [uncultured Nocardioides sp.]